MKPNMGSLDRAARVIIAVGIAVLYFTGTISGTVGIALLIVGVVFVGTSAAGTCPAYLPLGLSTRKE